MRHLENDGKTSHEVIVESITDEIKNDFEVHKRDGINVKEFDIERTIDVQMEDFEGVYFAYHSDLSDYLSENPNILKSQNYSSGEDLRIAVISVIEEKVREDVSNSDIVKNITEEVERGVSKDVTPDKPKLKPPSL